MVYYPAQTDSRSYAVLEALGGHRDSPIPSTHKPSFDSKEPPSKRPRRLFRLSDASGELQFNIVKENSKISRDDLESSDVFLRKYLFSLRAHRTQWILF